MGVLDGTATETNSSRRVENCQSPAFAILSNGYALDQFHDKVRPPASRGTAVENSGNIRMVHHRQGLTLCLRAGNDLSGVHPQLDDLERHPTADRLGLFGQIDDATSALADSPQKLNSGRM